MGILWTFMSASAPYTIFTGIVETVTGILLAMIVSSEISQLFRIFVLRTPGKHRLFILQLPLYVLPKPLEQHSRTCA